MTPGEADEPTGFSAVNVTFRREHDLRYPRLYIRLQPGAVNGHEGIAMVFRLKRKK
jgi:hypothetical protein